MKAFRAEHTENKYKEDGSYVYGYTGEVYEIVLIVGISNRMVYFVRGDGSIGEDTINHFKDCKPDWGANA